MFHPRNTLTVLLLLTGGLAPFRFCVSPLCAAEPFLSKTDLFEAGVGSYALYRIPGIVVTPRGTLLAYCEARRTTRSDWDAIDILMRRSKDGGKTWQPRRKIVEVEGPIEKNPAALAQKVGKKGDITYNNPVAIVDRTTGVVHFLFCVEYMRCFYCRSVDDGMTFSAPVEITAALNAIRKDYPWKAFGTGPGHGIQLSNRQNMTGRPRNEGGRLLVPVWLSTGTGGNAHRPSILSLLYSDDHGRTWKAGEVVARDGEGAINPNETTAVQLADGRVMFNIRSESKEHRRAVSFSKDGVAGWTRPVFVFDLPEPICMASIVRLSEKPGRNRLLFSNPHNLDRASGKVSPGQSRDRKNLSVKLSYDEGQTWRISKTLEAGFSGYSDLAVGPNGTIYCFYERGSTDGKSSYRTGLLTVARFNLEWLTNGKDSLVAPK